VATGPFRPTSWKADESIEAEAVDPHWRQTPGFKNLKVLEIPEASSQVAMLETGEADIGMAPLKDMKRLESEGLQIVGNGFSAYQCIYVSGNFWEKETPDGATEDGFGPLFPRPGFQPDDDHPWIGDPDDEENMERARKVRWAMSYAIDREAINDTVLDGLGGPHYVAQVPPNDPMMKDEWIIPYDPAKAKELLTEAGFSNCFDLPLFIPPDSGYPPETGEAVATFWTNLGCNVEIEKTSYSVRRPTEVKREIDIPWLFVWNHGAAAFAEDVLDPISFSQPGWNRGIENRESHDWFIAQAKMGDREERKQLALERAEWYHNWQIAIMVTEVPRLAMMNPDSVKGWKTHFEGVTFINNLEAATPVK
jgi:ABC-type transport system substrate-binding protein